MTEERYKTKYSESDATIMMCNAMYCALQNYKYNEEIRKRIDFIFESETNDEFNRLLFFQGLFSEIPRQVIKQYSEEQ